MESNMVQIWKVIVANKEWLFSGLGIFIIGIVSRAVYLFYRRIKNRVMDIPALINLSKKSRDQQYLKSPLIDQIGIDDIVKEHYPTYAEFLVVQYGSSVRGDCSSPNDYDFIVLLIGYPGKEKESPDIYEIGHSPRLGLIDADQRDVDVVFRDYNSFLFALVAGMPYENSVVSSGRLIHGPQGYFMWLRRIARNILIDRDFLLRRFQDDKLPVERDKWKESTTEHYDSYTCVRAAYYYICSLIQRNLIKNMDDVILHKNISKIAVAEYLLNQLQDNIWWPRLSRRFFDLG